LSYASGGLETVLRELRMRGGSTHKLCCHLDENITAFPDLQRRTSTPIGTDEEEGDGVRK